jgi:hypothetical protein
MTILVDAQFDPDRKYIELVYREPSNKTRVVSSQTVPDRVFKKRYVVQDGRIVLDRVIEGIHRPAQIIDEVFTFEE